MKRLLVLLAACASETTTTSDLAPPADGFQLDEGKFVVEAGSEGLYCMRLAIPDGDDGPLYVRELESRLPVGTHHFFMAYKEDHIDASRPCFVMR